MLETIEQAVKPHDKYQVETKLDYQLSEGRRTHYRVSTYIFVPQSLGIDQVSYNKDDFYRDVQNYIRLKTPTLILREFTEHSASPLNGIARVVANEGWVTDPVYREQLINNFKLLSAMLKSSIREHLSLIHRRIDEAAPHSKVHLMIISLVEEFLVETKKITDRYRAFYPHFNLPNIDEPIFTGYEFTDESLSLMIEESAAELLQLIDHYLKKHSKAEFRRVLRERMQAETAHRRAMGYPSILREDDDNEEYIFRTSVLKKYAASVLYLSTDVSREGTMLEQLLFAVAAGISMIFATVVAFYVQRVYGYFTLPVFAALVVGYMFKDRIKEAGRSIFARYLQNALFDRRIIIRTQDGEHRLGVLREKVSFIKESDLPRPVMNARNRDRITDLDNDGQGERIICYKKEIILFADVFKKIFGDGPEISGVNDIMRYDIRAYLRKMDEPVQIKYCLDEDVLKPIVCHKVYHLNFISRYRSLEPHKEKTHRRIRLVLDQRGIKRIEQVPI
jgi:hypothetical protein